MNSRRWITLGATLGTLALPAAALAHLERPSYWPDPAPGQSPSSPPAGGKVPKLRSLESAVTGKGAGRRAGGLPGQERARSRCGRSYKSIAAALPPRGIGSAPASPSSS